MPSLSSYIKQRAISKSQQSSTSSFTSIDQPPPIQEKPLPRVRKGGKSGAKHQHPLTLKELYWDPVMARIEDTAQAAKQKGVDLATDARQKAAEATRGKGPLDGYLFMYNSLCLLAWAFSLYSITQFLIANPILPFSRTPLTATSQLSSLFSSLAPSNLASTFKPKPPPSFLGLGLAKHLPASLQAPLGKLKERLAGSYDYNGLGPFVAWTQTAAVLDVLHAFAGIVRSDWRTVMAQVGSRLWSVWGVVEPYPETHNNPLYTTMVLAWSLAEVIKYSFYACNLLNVQIPLLNWLRYNAFFILYPLGAGSEAFLMLSTLPPLSTLPTSLGAHLRRKKGLLGGLKVPKSGWGLRDLGTLVLFVGWWPALLFLMSHMMKLRRKYMRKGKTLAGAKKTQ